jgi:hypothetical protein
MFKNSVGTSQKTQRVSIINNNLLMLLTEFRSIGQGEVRHRKYKWLKLGYSQAYDRSSD